MIKTIALSIVLSFISSNVLLSQAVSTYLPSMLEARTIEVIDSTLNMNGGSSILIAHGLSGKRGEQYNYWNLNYNDIPIKDFHIIKNHPSPVIRYYAYNHIIQQELVDSKVNFIIEQSVDNQAVRMIDGCTGGGYGTPMYFAFKNAYLSPEDNDLIAKCILKDEKVDSSGWAKSTFINHALSQLVANDSNYSILRSFAKKKNSNAIEKLLSYKKNQDEEFFIELVHSIIESNNSHYYNRKIIQDAVWNNYPKGTIDTIIAFHNKMKSENKLEEYFRKSKYLYQIIVDINHSNRAEILLDVAKVIDFSNRNTWSSFRKIVRESSGQDLIELRITLLEEFGILVDLSFSKIKKHYPERTLAAVMKILNALEKDECRSLIGHRTLNPSDFRAFIKFIKEESLSPEKYINWALRSNKSIDPFSILNISIENPFPTSKIEILNLTKLSDLSDIKEPKMKYRDILQSLLAYELSNSERNELKQWSKSVKENFTYTRFDSHKRSKNEEYELKLGIQL